MPHAGGQYVYLREAFGPLFGFLYGWTLFLVIQTGTIAAVAVAFAKFAGVFFPSISAEHQLAPFLNTQQFVAIAVLVVLTWVNTRGVRAGSVVQNVFTAAKVGALVALIGFGTHAGTVAAASDWGGAMEVTPPRPSRADSIERTLHDAGLPRFVLDLRAGQHEVLRRRLCEPRLQRYVGVIYRPETERLSHYAEASFAQQYDAFVWFDETGAVTPLANEPQGQEAADTFPFGL